VATQVSRLLELIDAPRDDQARHLVHPRVSYGDVVCCSHATCSVEVEAW
jgi:hypothetical protein